MIFLGYSKYGIPPVFQQFFKRVLVCNPSVILSARPHDHVDDFVNRSSKLRHYDLSMIKWFRYSNVTAFFVVRVSCFGGWRILIIFLSNKKNGRYDWFLCTSWIHSLVVFCKYYDLISYHPSPSFPSPTLASVGT